METGNYLKKFEVAPKRITPEQGLATEIYEGFSKRVPFGRIMGIIRRIGHQAAYEAWRSSQEGKSPIPLFLWTCGKHAEATKLNEAKK